LVFWFLESSVFLSRFLVSLRVFCCGRFSSVQFVSYCRHFFCSVFRVLLAPQSRPACHSRLAEPSISIRAFLAVTSLRDLALPLLWSLRSPTDLGRRISATGPFAKSRQGLATGFPSGLSFRCQERYARRSICSSRSSARPGFLLKILIFSVPRPRFGLAASSYPVPDLRPVRFPLGQALVFATVVFFCSLFFFGAESGWLSRSSFPACTPDRFSGSHFVCDGFNLPPRRWLQL
jgi:hypothetical protein